MAKKSNKSQFALAMMFLFPCLCVVIALFLPTQLSLVFHQENTDEIAAYLPVTEAQKFDIIWTHSIHLTDVVEKYQITETNSIMQYEIIYEQFGIGMPSNAQEGEIFESKDGKYHIENLTNVFPSMNIRNGKTVSKHRLNWEDVDGTSHQVYFNDYFEPGAWFKVEVERLSLLQIWKEVRIHD